MNISMQLAVVVAAACLCLSDAAPEARLARKSQRPTRGFKNVEMMTARGFGKRDRPPTRSEHEQIRMIRRVFKPNAKVLIARGYGKRNVDSDEDEVYGLENFWEMLESPEREAQEGDDKQMESIHIPLDWFVSELMNNPDFARAVVRKFIDLNQDGNLSADELLRNVI